jgi:hypothetical protein
MRSKKINTENAKPAGQTAIRSQSNDLSTIISARTGLTPADSAVMRTLPKNYLDKTVGEALDYLLQEKGLKSDELSLAHSIRKEMRARDYVVVINGKNAGLEENISDYLAKKEHSLPNGEVKTYNALEIEVSAVQEGGYRTF